MIFGKKIALRAWQENDLETLSALRNDVELQSQLMAQPRPNSMERTRQWLSEKSNREDGLFFVIADTDQEVVLGYVQLVNLNVLHGTCELGLCLAPWAQRKGFGRETLLLLEPYIRVALALRKVLLYVLADNRPAVSFYHECGFSEAGRLREHFRVGTSYRDVLVMEKLLRP